MTETNAMNDVRQDVESLKQDMARIRNDLSQLASNSVSAGKQGARHARDYGAQKYEQAREYGEQAVENVQHRIEERPITAVGGAFVIGVLIGALLGRSRG